MSRRIFPIGDVGAVDVVTPWSDRRTRDVVVAVVEPLVEAGVAHRRAESRRLLLEALEVVTGVAVGTVAGVLRSRLGW